MKEKFNKILQNKELLLKSLTKEDVTNDYVIGLNDPEVNEFLVEVKRDKQTKDSVEKYIISNQQDPNAVLYGIFEKDGHDKCLIGTIHVSGISKYHGVANIGICIFAKKTWGKGYGTKALQLVKDYLFEVCNIHYLEAGVYKKNEKSLKAFARAGFEKKYEIIEKYRCGNSFETVVIMAVINDLFKGFFAGNLKRNDNEN